MLRQSYDQDKLNNVVEVTSLQNLTYALNKSHFKKPSIDLNKSYFSKKPNNPFERHYGKEEINDDNLKIYKCLGLRLPNLQKIMWLFKTFLQSET